MHDFESLSHVRWECKYHMLFIPKYRQKVLFGQRPLGALRAYYSPNGAYLT